MYRKLSKDENLLRIKCNDANLRLGTEYDTNEFIAIIRNVNFMTICEKLRSFHYRFALRAIITNVQLKMYKIKEHDRCSFCNENRETIAHMFFECKYVQVLWLKVAEWLRIDRLTYTQIYSNKIVPNPRHAENSVVLIVKHYLYRARCLQERISVTSCENYIKQYRSIEECIAKSKNKLDRHILKWSNLF